MFCTLVAISKVIKLVTNTLKLGAGYTWPGHIALSLSPSLLKSSKICFTKGLILISGTNGKTTTSKLITHILEKSLFTVVSNASGANLKNGIAAAVLLASNIRGLDVDFGVFEVDEFALPEVLKDLSPSVLLLLNLSRDQLDRYGETDTILAKWQEAVSNLNPDTKLLVDASQQEILAICGKFSERLLTFDAQDRALRGSYLRGLFNAKNINAATLACGVLGVSQEEILEGVKTFVPAYGRGEKLDCFGKTFHILLAKNPASFNYNLDAVLASEFNLPVLLFVLNDNIPDGRDVSWLYDIDPGKLKKACVGKTIYIAGDRGLDMALRLKHAGVSFSEDSIFQELDEAFKAVAGNTASEVLVLPNYSAMLEVRGLLLGRKIL